MVFKAVSEKIDFDAVKESTTLTGEALAKKLTGVKLTLRINYIDR